MSMVCCPLCVGGRWSPIAVGPMSLSAARELHPRSQWNFRSVPRVAWQFIIYFFFRSSSWTSLCLWSFIFCSSVLVVRFLSLYFDAVVCYRWWKPPRGCKLHVVVQPCCWTGVVQLANYTFVWLATGAVFCVATDGCCRFWWLLWLVRLFGKFATLLYAGPVYGLVFYWFFLSRWMVLYDV